MYAISNKSALSSLLLVRFSMCKIDLSSVLKCHLEIYKAGLAYIFLKLDLLSLFGIE